MDKIKIGNNGFRCYFCCKTLVNKYIAQRHLRTHTKEKPFRCGFCCKSFMDPYQYNQHEKTHLQFLQDLDLTLLNSITSCGVCSESFGDRGALHRHVLVHLEKVFKCGICYKLFSDRDQGIRHEKTHPETHKKALPKPQNSCDVCDKSFRQKDTLRKHFLIHGSEEPFKCGICWKLFSVRDNWTRHEESHPEYLKRQVLASLQIPKPHPCDFCDKSFRANIDLERHRRIHTGEKPFKCRICGKSFTDPAGAPRHEKIHGKQPLPKLLRLTSHSCDVCDKSFSNKQDLERHRRIHTGEKPFNCRICEQAFNDRTNCKRHERRHALKGPAAVQKPSSYRIFRFHSPPLPPRIIL